ncbi:hypothetical protein PAHAL_5G540000 [Panicum hallii]|uniref:Uncharacterized protein n=1 Tax=Panicum hallii TaxID=206008 RepID=A0A2T8IPL2_9POAL|nr:hypothetical protein PAHAL_5G540000 [Panicum hallii]
MLFSTISRALCSVRWQATQRRLDNRLGPTSSRALPTFLFDLLTDDENARLPTSCTLLQTATTFTYLACWSCYYLLRLVDQHTACR